MLAAPPGVLEVWERRLWTSTPDAFQLYVYVCRYFFEDVDDAVQEH